MKGIDREKLSEYIEKSVVHEENPESFKYQMEVEIDKYLKQHEQHLKLENSKMRFMKKIDQDGQRRKILQEHIDEKLKRGEKNRMKKIQESTQSLADLKKRRQEMHSQKYREQKKSQLRKSLQKIKEFEEQKQAAELFRLNKSASEAVSKYNSRYPMREESDNAEYNALVDRLKEKGLYSIPQRMVQSLYNKRAEKIRIKIQDDQKAKQNKLGKSLDKINKARSRKEAILAKKVDKVEKNEKYQFQLHKNRCEEIEASERKKRKQLIRKHAQDAQRKSSLSKYEDKMNNEPSQLKTNTVQVPVTFDQSSVTSSQNPRNNVSYKQSIREHINKFAKQQL